MKHKSTKTYPVFRTLGLSNERVNFMDLLIMQVATLWSLGLRVLRR